MRALPEINPSPEQLSIFSRNQPGIEIIRGAAGSGKTTTALLRLRSLISMFKHRKERIGLEEEIRVLVLTYNRTLRGYIKELAKSQVPSYDGVSLKISTFAKWAKEILNNPIIVDDDLRRNVLLSFKNNLSFSDRFFLEEIEYVIGRFLPDNLNSYLTIRRDGRGAIPRVEQRIREILLNNAILPYKEWLIQNNWKDWNDLAVDLYYIDRPALYDIIVTDETQDFSANQLRAITKHLKKVSSLTLVIDTVQRIYARGFTWKETGIVVRPEQIRSLVQNYRNTVEIARFAMPLLNGIPIDDDSSMPDFTKCTKRGPKPLLILGNFNNQLNFVIRHIKNSIDLNNESIAFLHPKGWFRYLKSVLRDRGLKNVVITKKSEWPEGDENIALSTLHSSKGLEFDHVFLLGLNAECFPHGETEDDELSISNRRLLAMGIGRAKKSVIIGYKPIDSPKIVNLLDPSTYDKVNL